MKTWFKKFWYGHGERLIYALMAFVIAIGFLYSGQQALVESAPTILIGVVTLFFNKARGSSIEHQDEEKPDAEVTQ